MCLLANANPKQHIKISNFHFTGKLRSLAHAKLCFSSTSSSNRRLPIVVFRSTERVLVRLPKMMSATMARTLALSVVLCVSLSVYVFVRVLSNRRTSFTHKQRQRHHWHGVKLSHYRRTTENVGKRNKAKVSEE